MDCDGNDALYSIGEGVKQAIEKARMSYARVGENRRFWPKRGGVVRCRHG